MRLLQNDDLEANPLSEFFGESCGTYLIYLLCFFVMWRTSITSRKLRENVFELFE